MPTVPEVAREALIVVGGAVLAAAVIAMVPGVRAWINKQWGDTPRPF
ncbi:MAG: hypothetical protein J0H69_00665 [Burkholderiales bacterium]|nr:hypothetical protein [Burkholderiales bacterium]